MLKLDWIIRVCISVCIYIYIGRRNVGGGFTCRRTFSCLWHEPSSFEGTSIDRALPLKGLITMENATVT